MLLLDKLESIRPDSKETDKLAIVSSLKPSILKQKLMKKKKKSR